MIKTIYATILLLITTLCWSSTAQTFLTHGFDINKNIIRIDETKLPAPYAYLLTQPLMTKGIERHYGRTAIIQILYAEQNEEKTIYSRIIRMLLDNNKQRNNPQLAQRTNQTFIAELAFITINFSALSKPMIKDVISTKLPFGALINKHHLNVISSDRSYFTIKCSKDLAALTHCTLNKTLYGRRNTLVDVKSRQWLAKVVEILL